MAWLSTVNVSWWDFADLSKQAAYDLFSYYDPPVWYNAVEEQHSVADAFAAIGPFLPTSDSDQVFPSAFQGQDGLLVAEGDVLTYQTWPGLIDFDAYSWRIIRRSPTATDPGEVGWVVQGPTLDPETAAPLGLESGTYGIGRCVMYILTSGLEYGWRGCDSWPFPPVPDPTTYGTDAARAAGTDRRRRRGLVRPRRAGRPQPHRVHHHTQYKQGDVEIVNVQSPALQDEPFAVFRPADPDADCGGLAADGAEISTHLQGEIGMSPERWFETLQGFGYPRSLEDSEIFWRTVFPDAVHLFPECADDAEVRGALEIATASWFSGYSRTYAVRPDGGTYGGMLPLYPPGGWPAQHFAGLEVNSEQRINVGLYNGSADHAVRHLLKLYSEDGTLAASRVVEVAPHRSVQRPLERLMGLAAGSLGEGLYGLSVIPLDDPGAGIHGRSWAYPALFTRLRGERRDVA